MPQLLDVVSAPSGSASRAGSHLAPHHPSPGTPHPMTIPTGLAMPPGAGQCSRASWPQGSVGPAEVSMGCSVLHPFLPSPVNICARPQAPAASWGPGWHGRPSLTQEAGSVHGCSRRHAEPPGLQSLAAPQCHTPSPGSQTLGRMCFSSLKGGPLESIYFSKVLHEILKCTQDGEHSRLPEKHAIVMNQKRKERILLWTLVLRNAEPHSRHPSCRPPHMSPPARELPGSRLRPASPSVQRITSSRTPPGNGPPASASFFHFSLCSRIPTSRHMQTHLHSLLSGQAQSTFSSSCSPPSSPAPFLCSLSRKTSSSKS